MSEKRCPQCGQTKMLSDFYPRHKTGGHQAYCKECSKKNLAQYGKERIESDPEYAESRRAYAEQWRSVPNNKIRVRARKYGWSIQEYLIQVDIQGGLCAICKMELPLQIDHDHDCCPTESGSCGKCNRGLLCAGCNNGIARFGDDPSRLVAAAEYLLRWKASSCASQ